MSSKQIGNGGTSTKEGNRNCRKCTRTDSADNMVGCDACETWEHYQCAGVSESIEAVDRSWKCERCRANTEAKEATKSMVSFTGTSVSKASRKSQRIELSLRLLEEQRNIEMKRLEKEEVYIKQKFNLLVQLGEDDETTSRRSQVSAKSKRERLEGWLQGTKVDAVGTVEPAPSGQLPEPVAATIPVEMNGAAMASTSTPLLPAESEVNFIRHLPQKTSTPTGQKIVASSTEIRNLIGLSMPEKVSNPAKQPPSIIARSKVVANTSSPVLCQNEAPMYTTNNPAHTKTPGVVSVPNFTRLSLNCVGVTGTRMSTSVAMSNNCIVSESNIISHPVSWPPGPVTSVTPMFTGITSSISSLRSRLIPESNIVFQQPLAPVALTASSNLLPVLEPIPQRQNLYGSGGEILHGPTNAQLAARQVMPKELPKFTGEPQDWPMFISSFINSTEVCGYTDAENLARLQRSLGGNALEAVRSRLLLPASVPYVLETLRKLYGRPEILINTLLKRVRSVTPPKSDNLHSIVVYGLVWGIFKRGRMDVNLATFNEFISDLMNVASDLSIDIDAAQNHAKCFGGEKGKSKEKLFTHTHESTAVKGKIEQIEVSTLKTCSYCSRNDHQIADCDRFQSLDVDGRWKAVRQRNLCRTCLVPHRKWPCRSKKECAVEGCRIHHHALLHSTRDLTLDDTTNPGHTVYQHHHFSNSCSLFRYLPVTLFGNGATVNTYVFLDDGSSSTLLEEEIAAQLGISGEPDVLWLSWTGKIGRQEKASQRVSIQIAGFGARKTHCLENVRTVRELGLPLQTMDYTHLSKTFPHLRGLPITNYTNVRPGMIIGLEHVRLLTTLKLREGGCNDPVAVKTRLGWCVYGRYTGGGNPVEHLNVHISGDVSNNQLHDTMKKFFLIEEAAVSIKLESASDRRALEILEQTTVRRENRYETGLLWKVDRPVFPESLPMAMKRLVGLERRLTRDPALRAKVEEQIKSYEEKGYAHRVSKEEIEHTDSKRVWYLPLGVVTSPKKPEKVRFIWDAAAKVNGVSFNDMLLKGPDLLTSLFAVLLRFRQRNIAVCGDIREMFHQILVREEDKQFQRFLWRNEPSDVAQIWVMDVATFGATCSPSIAQAVDIIIDDHYVDDCLFSVDTVDEAVQLTQEVKAIHAAAGFELVKLQSNSTAVLSFLGEPDRLLCKTLSVDQPEESERVLGLMWIPSADIFTFQVTEDVLQLIDRAIVPTKRQILRTVMKIFDPLGFIAHFVVHGKTLMQEVWRSGTDWDEVITEHLVDRWFRWTAMLKQISDVRVPRFYFRDTDFRKFGAVQVHVLTDASEEAYACVAYLRVATRDGGRCAFLTAKTKVAPLKPLSIPRLELQAAMLGARLMQTICTALTLNISKRILWTDSATVLAWLRSETRRYHQFVSFRIGEILSLTRMDEWRHVPTKLNVADEATKWGSGPKFDPCCRWFKGPTFLGDVEVA
ncbi:uncharacterized protein LOC129766466 [Toxorhynchites rutilus septentrionalis]|uniref:uncharacterized protein LOC129766466 n=1 Tax=Toxorhynchites rutilus septentrionalis TaxID=329112 RepID=UPI00247A26B8|nr:uncharacterized protein LOC129766466 [Toxorhynchites rutilus septentrionalis]